MLVRTPRSDGEVHARDVHEEGQTVLTHAFTNMHVNGNMPKNRKTNKPAIPPGFSTRHWDPNEEPIVLLGSVFDANSLGKWIYDWTASMYGGSCPMLDLVGDLWLLLIHLAAKFKRANAFMDRVADPDDREMIDDFLISFERLWLKLKGILNRCEESMMMTEMYRSGGVIPKKMSIGSGYVFVYTLLSRDHELDAIEKLMSGIRLWIARFATNCEEIIEKAVGPGPTRRSGGPATSSTRTRRGVRPGHRGPCCACVGRGSGREAEMAHQARGQSGPRRDRGPRAC